MHIPDGRPTPSGSRRFRRGPGVNVLVVLALGTGAVGVIAGGTCALTDSTPTFVEGSVAAGAVTAIAQTTSPTPPVGDPIRELPAPSGIRIRNEVDGIAEILVIGAGASPITVGIADGSKVHVVSSGTVTIDVQDAHTGRLLVHHAELQLAPDRVTTIRVRGDASGAVVESTAP
jgi:hypothetical protein